ncbi:MAG: GNAT family N-acetyltransferase [Candidatus Eisenbacteria bacterium]|nr:GNAT family N-acetyltransferase [Candidatus Eisenbacteria bacterium]
MAIEIREYRPDEYEQVRALWEACEGAIGLGRSDTPEEIEKMRRFDPGLFLVAAGEGGTIAGTVIGGFDGRRGHVYHLAVAPDSRRSGLGRRLMAEIERRLVARGAIRAHLMVMPGNEQAIRFYESIGWSVLPITAMSKNLEAPAEG